MIVNQMIDIYSFMSLITHRVRINIYRKKIYKKDTFDYKHWERDRCHIFRSLSSDFYHCLLDEKLWGVDWYNRGIFDVSSFKQPVKFKDRNMRDKYFLQNWFFMLILKFYPPNCLKKSLLFTFINIQTQVSFLASFEKKMNLKCLKIKKRNSDWNLCKKKLKKEKMKTASRRWK